MSSRPARGDSHESVHPSLHPRPGQRRAATSPAAPRGRLPSASPARTTLRLWNPRPDGRPAWLSQCVLGRTLSPPGHVPDLQWWSVPAPDTDPPSRTRFSPSLALCPFALLVSGPLCPLAGSLCHPSQSPPPRSDYHIFVCCSCVLTGLSVGFFLPLPQSHCFPPAVFLTTSLPTQQWWLPPPPAE